MLRKLFAVLAAIVLASVAAIYVLSERRMGRTYTIQPAPIEFPSDVTAIERGRHLAATIGNCLNCHGGDLGGASIEHPMAAHIRGNNLTAGAGGIGKDYTDIDFVRAIRHGVGRDGRSLQIMPAMAFEHFTAADLAAIVAWVRSMPPVDRTQEKVSLGLVGRFMLVADMLPLLSAEHVQHDAPYPDPVSAGVTVAYGRYLAHVAGCADCHHQDLTGGHLPGTSRMAPAAANLTPSGPLGKWSEAEFFLFFRTGRGPDGREAHSMMPWRQLGGLTDDELRAIRMYLGSLPPR